MNTNLIILTDEKLKEILNDFSKKVVENCFENLLKNLNINKNDLRNFIFEKNLDKKKFLNLSQASKFLKISRSTLWRYIKQNKIKINEFNKIDFDDLKNFLNKE